jgi:hypothetical protein
MRGSSLDLVKAELAALKPRLSSSDVQRLDRHAESVRDLERSLTSLQNQIASCKPLTQPAAFDPYNSTYYKESGFFFFKMIAMAFACDLTRSVQFNWSGNTNNRIYRNLNITTGHHDLSHISDDTSFTNIRAIKKHLFELSCQLHTELKALPEAGGTVWDNSLVVHWSELSQGDTHAINNDLVVLAGGAGNHFRMGRYLNLVGQSRRSFSDVLVSCFHYMGFTDVSTFGYAALGGGGPLPNLT